MTRYKVTFSAVRDLTKAAALIAATIDSLVSERPDHGY